MDNITNVKERIISVTTELINQYNGETKDITSRMIAEKANVGLGLINYHFGSKNNLITECVQRIIGKVVAGFRMNQEFQDDKSRLTASATYVFDFLFEYSAICRISILGDFQNYTTDCNSVHTQQGFSCFLKNDIPGKDKSLLIFVLTAAMQVAFLGADSIKQVLGYDFNKPEDRADYIKRLIDILFNGMVNVNE